MRVAALRALPDAGDGGVTGATVVPADGSSSLPKPPINKAGIRIPKMAQAVLARARGAC
jgi:hypothetical protein